MTYNEWRDELKSNLLSVPERERRRVLDYYAEAYADRRDAGFSEREIIEDFGAPYDAAQRILAENGGDYSGSYYDEPVRRDERDIRREEKERRLEMKQREREERRRRDEYEREERRREQERERERRNGDRRGYDDPFYDDNRGYTPPPPPPAPQPAQSTRRGDDYTWVFVLLCIIFCVPLFGLIIAMVVVTIGFCVAPFALLITGIITAGAGIGAIVSGEALAGLCTVGVGIMIFGVSVILIAVFPRLVKLMWTLFRKTMSFIKSLFSGKEAV